jgi:hypothetical protein
LPVAFGAKVICHQFSTSGERNSLRLNWTQLISGRRVTNLWSMNLKEAALLVAGGNQQHDRRAYAIRINPGQLLTVKRERQVVLSGQNKTARPYKLPPSDHRWNDVFQLSIT